MLSSLQLLHLADLGRGRLRNGLAKTLPWEEAIFLYSDPMEGGIFLCSYPMEGIIFPCSDPPGYLPCLPDHDVVTVPVPNAQHVGGHAVASTGQGELLDGLVQGIPREGKKENFTLDSSTAPQGELFPAAGEGREPPLDSCVVLSGGRTLTPALQKRAAIAL